MTHILARVLIIIGMIALAIVINLVVWSGGRDGIEQGMAVLFSCLVSFLMGLGWLVVESIKFHCQGNLRRRNSNLLLVIFLIVGVGMFVLKYVLGW